MNPPDDPAIRFVAARILAREYLAKAEDTVAAMDRLRYRARRYLAIANEAMREAEASATDLAVQIGEEREIEREVWR
jgi:hypothetical protein